MIPGCDLLGGPRHGLRFVGRTTSLAAICWAVDQESFYVPPPPLCWADHVLGPRPWSGPRHNIWTDRESLGPGSSCRIMR